MISSSFKPNQSFGMEKGKPAKHSWKFLTRLIWILALLCLRVLPGRADTVILHGRVVDADSKQALSGVTVEISRINRSEITGPTGAFHFADVPAGDFVLVASKDGYVAVTASVSAINDLEVNFELPLAPVRVDTAFVTGTAEPEPISGLSRSVGVVNQQDLSVTRLVGFDETLNEIPGVKAESQNGTQEVRISIRGRGERETFGDRDVKILVDGVPETDASGETTDFTGVDIGSLERIEVVRGPMSAEYGAGASGVVQGFTTRGGPEPDFEFRSTEGSFGLNDQLAAATGSFGRLLYSLEGSHDAVDGYRQHSSDTANRFTGRLDYELGKATELSFFGKFGDLASFLPGNLTARQWAANPFQASPSFKLYNAQSDLSREQGAVRLTHFFAPDQSLTAMFYARALDYRLPEPGIFITGVRNEEGGGLKYRSNRHLASHTNIFEVGADYQFQNEKQIDFNNLFGVKGTILERDQSRYVGNQSYFAYDRFSVGRKLDIIGSVDFAHLVFSIGNYFANPPVFAGPVYSRGSFQVGASYHISSRVSAYGNVSTGFAPPTITELGRDPNGGPGLNLSLKPEYSTNYEGGILARLFSKTYITLDAFKLDVQNEIVPTGIGYPQVSYTNAGRSVHNGLEAALDAALFGGLSLKSAFTYANAYYATFSNPMGDFSGNRIPAIPRSRLFSTLYYSPHRSHFYGALQDYYVSKFFVNDANTALNNQYNTVAIYAGYRRLLEMFEFNVMFRVDNLTDRRYADYVVIDDQFGAYYYPSAPRNYTGVVSVALHLHKFSSPRS